MGTFDHVLDQDALGPHHLFQWKGDTFLIVAGLLEGGVGEGLGPATSSSLEEEDVIDARWLVGGWNLGRHSASDSLFVWGGGCH